MPAKALLLVLFVAFFFLPRNGSGQRLAAQTKNSLTASSSLDSINKPANACGVTASFTPSNDTAFNTPGVYTLTNTSINAISYQWIINGRNYFFPTDLSIWFNVGVHEVSLIAINGNCRDTAKVLIVVYGDASTNPYRLKVQYGAPGLNDDASTLVACPEGGYLLAGSTPHLTGSVTQWYNDALLIRIKEQGCVEWSKVLDGQRVAKINRILVTRDSGFLLSATDFTPANPFSGLLIRLDKNGNTVWTKSFADNNSPYKTKSLAEAPDGSIVGVAEISSWHGLWVFRIDPLGNLIWNREFVSNANLYTRPHSILIKGNSIYVTGFTGMPNTANDYNHDGLLLKMDLSSGNEIWTRTYDADDGTNFFQDIHVMGQRLLVNDLTVPYVGSANSRQLFHYIDEDGNPVRNYIVHWETTHTDPINSNLVPISDGKFYIFHKSEEGISNYRNFFIKTDTNQNIYWQYAYSNSNYTRMYEAVRAPNDGIAAIGIEGGELFKAFSSMSLNIGFFRSDSTGQAFDQFCYSYSTQNTIEPISTSSQPFQWPINVVKNVRDTSLIIDPLQQNIELRYGCPDYISKCSFLEVTGPDKPCDLNQTYTFRAKKDRMCGEPVSWELDPSMRVIAQSDTALQVQFTSYGNYSIKVGLPYSCTPMRDSILISIAPRLQLLNLGKDTSICARDTFQLHAGKDFINYRWQDGSTDSTFRVDTPGLYYVEVTDSCGNKKTDSIVVSPAAPLSINIGPDRSICYGDTVLIPALSGFNFFLWSPPYNIRVRAFGEVALFPDVDTTYTLRAENQKGCYGLDTIQIKVNRPDQISLGNDTSFCSGNSVLLDAGPGFQSYRWSNGNSGQQISVTNKGIYSVMTTDANNCQSYDTIEIKNVFAIPAIYLPNNPFLCVGESRVLDAGPGYIQYNWNDGSSGSQITVTGTGTYWVNVIDANNCVGGDTTNIDQLVPPPANFLPVDTSICSYGKLTLIPVGNFKSYAWSNGSVTNGITIDKPGTYSLTVTDMNGCKGTDAVIVTKKDCLQGFYVPNAFTPNNDRNNPTFRPLLFGNVKQYRFSVYNRYGQRVFETTELLKGWDGTIGGLQQNSGTYVWTCTYQFENEPVKTEKGTVILIK